jgi:hypothetical protein
MVDLTVWEYDAVRADPTHFVVAPSIEHAGRGVERVVERHEGFWVVEMLEGDQARSAQTNTPSPRSRPQEPSGHAAR